MQFIRADWDEATAAVSKRLVSELAAGRHVLWLVSGGSQVPANIKIMAQIPDGLSQNLSVMPIDERYGPPGHADSNWAKLTQSGFQPKEATLLPALKEGLDFAQNTAYYNSLAEQAFASNTVAVGQLGIGTDGHTAGILPNSPACTETALVSGYKAPPLWRMTLTFPALKKLSVAFVMAYGEAKRQTLQALQSRSLSASQQPAQALKSLREAYLYNDQVGDT